MTFSLIKVGVSACLIVLITEISRRSGWLGGLIASLPLISILSFAWLYYEQRDNRSIITLCESIPWFLIPSFTLFLLLPVLLKRGMGFPLALVLSCLAMMLAYAAMTAILAKFGIKL